MRALLLALRRRMLVKIFAAVALVVACALFGLAWRQSRGENAALKESARSSAEQLARVIVGNVEVAMLQGAGIHVKNQVKRTKQAVASAEIEIFDPRGLEVFGELPPAPAKETLPPPLLATLTDAQRRVEGGRDWRPIANDTRCHACHPAEPALRGVLSIAPRTGPPAVREDVMASLVKSAFVQVMSAEHEGELTAYFAELSVKIPTIRQIGVYGRGRDVAFGVEVPGVTADMLDASLSASSRPTRASAAGGSVELIPLVMEDRCEQCHEPDETSVRGVLAIAMAPADPTQQTELATLIDISLSYIMLSSLGRMISAFLDDVVLTGAVDEIALHDAAGRVYYTSEPPLAPLHVTAALATRLPSSSFVGTGRDERVRVVHPLANDAKCARCHGSDSALRGVVTVSLSTRAAAEAREAAARRATVFIAIALVLVLVVLYTLLQALVVSPVQRIGSVADQVGSGRLDVSVPDVRTDGDEIDRLGLRINEMIRGLRTELHLRRFVSKGTAEAARGAANAATTSGHLKAAVGERCSATILFTDIRGFTAYAETVEPETVVDMLNRFLQAQADVVERYGGDIDKYVGDEVMAVFHGDDGAARAIRAALDMVVAVESAREHGEALTVGCGISTGEVISGPIGSTARMDFTVIGDVVNTGARLCSAARASEVIVSVAVRDAVGELPDIELVALEPLQLKGKREPFAVFRAVRRVGS